MLFGTPSVFRRRTIFAFACILGLTSCASHNPGQHSRQALQDTLVKNHPELADAFLTGANPGPSSETAIQPLTPELALRLLLQRSPRVAMELDKLGLADTQTLQASLLANPRISFALLRPDSGGSWLWDFGLSQSLKDFFTRGLRQQQADWESVNAQFEVSRQLQNLIGELQQDYFLALAAKQAAGVQSVAVATARAKKELAASLYQAGNISELSYLDYAADLQDQQLAQLSSEKNLANCLDKLAYLLGVAGQPITLPDSLPRIPAESFDPTSLTAEAISTRLDVLLLQQQQQQIVASQLALTRREYGIGDSSLGVVAQRDADGTLSKGAELALSLPVFDRGQAKLAAVRLQQHSLQSVLTDRKLQIAMEVRQSITNATKARQEQAQLEANIALAEKRLLLAQREVNFMLLSPFDLLDRKTSVLQPQLARGNALLAYWQARSQLELALGRQLPLAAAASANASASDSTITNASSPNPNSGSADANRPSGEHKHD